MTVSARGQGSTPLPPDFAQRGVAVPFTTRLLFFARARRATDGTLEFLVPGLAGGLKTCVIPHGKIGETLSMTVFDRALMEELADISTITPATVEQAALSVGSTGLGGSRLMQRAHRRAEADRFGTLALEGLLTNGLLAAFDEKPIDVTYLELEDLRARARTALEPHAAKLDAPVDAILSRLAQWAQIILPIGSEEADFTGPYVATLGDMERFAAELSTWLIPEPVGPAEMAQRIAVAARKTAAAAHMRIDRIDEYRGRVPQSLRDWDTVWASLTADVEMISNIIDGWQRLVDKWDAVSRMDRVDQREIVELFALYLPVLPRKAVDENHDFWTSIRENQKRWNASVGTPDLMATDDDLKDKIGDFKVEHA